MTDLLRLSWNGKIGSDNLPYRKSFLGGGRSMSVEFALLNVAQTLQMEVYSKQSQDAYLSDTKVFIRWLDGEGIELEAIDYDAMLRYHAYLLANFAKATAARRFVVARRLLDVAVKKGVIKSNPASDVVSKIRKDDSSPHTALTKKEAKRLLESVDNSTVIGKRDYALLMLLIYGGIRRSECAAIKIKDITLKQEYHVLTIQEGKGNKRRDVPLRPDVFRAISAYMEQTDRLNDDPENYLFTGFLKGQKPTHRGITDRQIANIVHGYSEIAHVSATPHDLRASAITYFIDTGAHIVQVQRLVGHSDPKTTEGYYTRKMDIDNSPVYKVDLNAT
jgi:site-specific recombinase XerD